MVKQGILPALSLTALLLAAQAIFTPTASALDANASPGRTPKASLASEPALRAPTAAASKSQATPSKPTPRAPAKKAPSQPTIGDGLVVQNTLRVYLSRPAIIIVHNARGQLLFHLETTRPVETLPLSGINSGFLYLTLRAGQLETSKKLLYSGK